MRSFFCHCGNQIFFENTVCVNCGRSLGYVPERCELLAIEELGAALWRPVDSADTDGPRYRKCAHVGAETPCNWLVPEHDIQAQCRSCRLTIKTADLTDARTASLWARAEVAKRRLIHTLDRIGLPLQSRTDDAESGLGFAMLMQTDDAPHSAIMTGHDRGLVTINLLEADDAARERVRLEMQERYRTLLGHFRHEIGHYYFLRLVAGSAWEEPFRALFGDERADYGAALAAYYRAGPVADWNQHYVSAYAAAHPLEDFAECFAHALHMTDALETAEAFGFIAQLPPAGTRGAFERRLSRFVDLSIGLNSLNRGLGLNDPYPFVHPPPAQAKLRLVDEILHGDHRRG